MTILDAGAKYGIHPVFKELEDLYNFILIDADLQEVKNLKKKYKNKKNIKCINTFLDQTAGNHISMNLYNHSGKNSFYQIKNEQAKKKNSIITSTIDSISEKIKFLKIDIEGKEESCLLGAKKQLKNNILGVRCEILLNSPYKGERETWSGVNKTLNRAGFEFMNFDIVKNVSFKSFLKYNYGDIFGKMYSADGIWVKKIKYILDSNDYEEIIDYSVFCIFNNLSDLAIKILKFKSSAIKKNIKKNAKYQKIFFLLELTLARIFFNLRKIPAYQKIVEKDFEIMFQKKWPAEGSFFNKYPLDMKI